MLRRISRIDPLGALIWLEYIALGSSFALDIIMATAHINGGPPDPRSLLVFSASFLISALALVFIPHAPNRRYAIIAIAIAAICATNTLPNAAISPIVLMVVLAARLTFAFGFAGSLLAWISAFLTLCLDATITFLAKPTTAGIFDLAVYIVGLTLLLTLLYGLIGIMWLYAKRGARRAAASERTRIALDLHDSLGHGLTTLSVHLQNAASLQDIDRDKTRSYLERATTLAQEILDDVRETVTILHDDAAVQALSINQLIDRLRSDFVNAHPYKLHWNVYLDKEPQGRSAIALYRILQEALTNIARHAQARQISVDVRGDRANVDLRVTDDGCGFDEEHQTGHGLVSMRSRVEALSGTITITSQEGLGTRIHATFPLEGDS